MVNITFLHPDLGIGGAERLIVDAAVALKKNDHTVRIITSHHDTTHCFPETINGSIPVTVVGDWLPRHILGKCTALCAYVRMLYAAFYVILFSDFVTDVAICDQVSVCIPVLHLKIKTVIFYCHFPDLLLSKPGSIVKRIYRFPLNWMEEKTTGSAEVILVNSNFTKETFKNTFTSLGVQPEVLHPSINTKNLTEIEQTSEANLSKFDLQNSVYFLSINRFERKKNIALAIEAFSCVQSGVSDELWRNLKLVIAGGYDVLVHENINYFKELQSLAGELGISQKVVFIKSPSEIEKIKLLTSCRCVVYTPENEHFGIVPLEAMYYGKPVIAMDNGGPKETIINEETGFLCDSDEAFAKAMSKCAVDESYCVRLGKNAKTRFEKCFSFDAFAKKLSDIVSESLSH